MCGRGGAVIWANGRPLASGYCEYTQLIKESDRGRGCGGRGEASHDNDSSIELAPFPSTVGHCLTWIFVTLHGFPLNTTVPSCLLLCSWKLSETEKIKLHSAAAHLLMERGDCHVWAETLDSGVDKSRFPSCMRDLCLWFMMHTLSGQQNTGARSL